MNTLNSVHFSSIDIFQAYSLPSLNLFSIRLFCFSFSSFRSLPHQFKSLCPTKFRQNFQSEICNSIQYISRGSIFVLKFSFSCVFLFNSLESTGIEWLGIFVCLGKFELNKKCSRVIITLFQQQQKLEKKQLQNYKQTSQIFLTFRFASESAFKYFNFNQCNQTFFASFLDDHFINLFSPARPNRHFKYKYMHLLLNKFDIWFRAIPHSSNK